MKTFFYDLLTTGIVTLIGAFCSFVALYRERIFLSELHIDENLAFCDMYPIFRYIMILCAPSVIFGVFLTTVYFYKDDTCMKILINLKPRFIH